MKGEKFSTNHLWYLPFCNLIDIYTDFMHLFVHLLNWGSVGVYDITVDSHFSEVSSHVSGFRQYHLLSYKLPFVSDSKHGVVTNGFLQSFRKMLTIEQFRSEEMQNLYQQYLVSGPAGYVKDLFKNMKIKDPEENAVKFYANMFFYYNVYDGAADKAKAKCQFEQMLDKIVEEMKQ